MKEKFFTVIQVLAGLILLAFGANTFLHFMPMPEAAPAMGEFLGALFKSGYVFPIIGVIKILAGLAFLSNKYAALMAVIIMPVMLNAFLAHLYLDPEGIAGSAFTVFAIIIVMIRYKDRYKEIFKS